MRNKSFRQANLPSLTYFETRNSHSISLKKESKILQRNCSNIRFDGHKQEENEINKSELSRYKDENTKMLITNRNRIRRGSTEPKLKNLENRNSSSVCRNKLNLINNKLAILSSLIEESPEKTNNSDYSQNEILYFSRSQIEGKVKMISSEQRPLDRNKISNNIKTVCNDEMSSRVSQPESSDNIGKNTRTNFRNDSKIFLGTKVNNDSPDNNYSLTKYSRVDHGSDTISDVKKINLKSYNLPNITTKSVEMEKQDRNVLSLSPFSMSVEKKNVINNVIKENIKIDEGQIFRAENMLNKELYQKKNRSKSITSNSERNKKSTNLISYKNMNYKDEIPSNLANQNILNEDEERYNNPSKSINDQENGLSVNTLKVDVTNFTCPNEFVDLKEDVENTTTKTNLMKPSLLSYNHLSRDTMEDKMNYISTWHFKSIMNSSDWLVNKIRYVIALNFKGSILAATRYLYIVAENPIRISTILTQSVLIKILDIFSLSPSIFTFDNTYNLFLHVRKDLENRLNLSMKVGNLLGVFCEQVLLRTELDKIYKSYGLRDYRIIDKTSMEEHINKCKNDRLMSLMLEASLKSQAQEILSLNNSRLGFYKESILYNDGYYYNDSKKLSELNQIKTNNEQVLIDDLDKSTLNKEKVENEWNDTMSKYFNKSDSYNINSLYLNENYEIEKIDINSQNHIIESLNRDSRNTTQHSKKINDFYPRRDESPNILSKSNDSSRIISMNDIILIAIDILRSTKKIFSTLIEQHPERNLRTQRLQVESANNTTSTELNELKPSKVNSGNNIPIILEESSVTLFKQQKSSISNQKRHIKFSSDIPISTDKTLDKSTSPTSSAIISEDNSYNIEHIYDQLNGKYDDKKSTNRNDIVQLKSMKKNNEDLNDNQGTNLTLNLYDSYEKIQNEHVTTSPNSEIKKYQNTLENSIKTRSLSSIISYNCFLRTLEAERKLISKQDNETINLLLDNEVKLNSDLDNISINNQNDNCDEFNNLDTSARKQLVSNNVSVPWNYQNMPIESSIPENNIIRKGKTCDSYVYNDHSVNMNNNANVNLSVLCYKNDSRYINDIDKPGYKSFEKYSSLEELSGKQKALKNIPKIVKVLDNFLINEEMQKYDNTYKDQIYSYNLDIGYSETWIEAKLSREVTLKIILCCVEQILYIPVIEDFLFSRLLIDDSELNELKEYSWNLDPMITESLDSLDGKVQMDTNLAIPIEYIPRDDMLIEGNVDSIESIDSLPEKKIGTNLDQSNEKCLTMENEKEYRRASYGGWFPNSFKLKSLILDLNIMVKRYENKYKIATYIRNVNSSTKNQAIFKQIDMKHDNLTINKNIKEISNRVQSFKNTLWGMSIDRNDLTYIKQNLRSEIYSEVSLVGLNLSKK